MDPAIIAAIQRRLQSRGFGQPQQNPYPLAPDPDSQGDMGGVLMHQGNPGAQAPVMSPGLLGPAMLNRIGKGQGRIRRGKQAY